MLTALRRILVAILVFGPCLAGPQVIADDFTAEEQEDRALKAAVAAVAPCVLRVEAVGGAEVIGKSLAATGPTTGVVVDKEGYLVSSAFNFINQPASILVTLPSGKRAAAEIVARDKSRMLVLLKIKTDEPLSVPIAVPKTEMRVGQWSVAVGRTFDSSSPGISVGVISALDRVWGKALQTDAKISPSNYGGALVDIRGRIFGILVPLSPHDKGSEVAGAEWYDSGIGFAVPLADIMAQLEIWKKGEDLQPGLLGISLKPGDMYVLPAEVVACPFNSPANKAGIKVGDVIVEAGGRPIERQAQLKHVLGPLYAGEKVSLVIRRGEEKIPYEAELVAELAPYDMPFLGILPGREKVEGVSVRWIYPGSPAEKAGLKAEDRIVQIDGQPVKDVVELRQKLATWEPKSAGSFAIVRGSEQLELKISAASQPADVPATLPPPFAPSDPAAARPAVGVVEVRLPEAENKCWAVIPENYNPASAHGLLIWLPSPQQVQPEQLTAKWQALAAAHGMIVLAPQPADPTKWEPTELEFVGKAADDLAKTYSIDPARVAVLGEQAGGALAWLMMTQQRDRIRGVALVDPTLPRVMSIPDSSPVQPLFFFAAFPPAKSKAADLLIGRFEEQKLPVTRVELSAGAKSLSGEQLEQVARWIDTLDRL